MTCQKQRSISPWTRTKTMKYHKTNLELFQTLSLQYLCYLSNQVPEKEIQWVDRSDQPPVPKVHRPGQPRQVHKEHRSVPVLKMNLLTTMTSPEKETLTPQSRVHGVMTQEGQCSTQTFIFWPMTSTGQWRKKHTSMQPQPGHFVSWPRKTETTRSTTKPCVQRSLCLDVVINDSSRWQVEFLDGVHSQIREAAVARAKRRSRARNEASGSTKIPQVACW